MVSRLMVNDSCGRETTVGQAEFHSLHLVGAWPTMENIFFVGSPELLREFVNGFQLPRK
jgi:hypothetical protein